MTGAYIPIPLRQQVLADFGRQCAYCHTLTSITGARLVFDHILPEAAGGATVRENLCPACHSCNEFKGTKTSVEDPITGEKVTLFNPREQSWRVHFQWNRDGGEIIGRTPIGRATVIALNMNHPDIVDARRRWALVGWHPPVEDL